VATYLTDSWSTISNLAAVAYGFADRYPEVANQVRSKSPIRVLGASTPSEIIRKGMDLSDLTSTLTQEYNEGGEFSRYVDSQYKSVKDIAEDLYEFISQSYNESSSYEYSLTDAMDYVGIPLDSQRVKNNLESLNSDLNLFSRLASSMSHNKLDKLPEGSRIQLDDSIDMAADYRGVSFDTGYLTPDQYFSNIAYPGLGATSNNIPQTLTKSVQDGYVGYSTTEPLESLSRPDIVDIISTSDISDLSKVFRPLSGLGTINTLKDLSGFGALSEADQVMYNVDISELVVDINGYTIYDPATDSNGDFIDTSLVPDYESDNSDTGLPYSSRTRSTTFES